MLIDTHAHLDDEAFDVNRDDVVERAQRSNVQAIITVGTTADASEKCFEIASRYQGVHAAVGIQPNHVHEANRSDWDRIIALVRRPKVVALGETGLDRYWDFAPFDLQQDYFDRHLRLSLECNLPFVVHMRDCGDEVVDMLQLARQRGPLRGVMHSFTGNSDLAQQCLDLGLYISFAGMVTYKKSTELREVAAVIPENRLLIETDSPYLSPEPVRGVRPNEPAHVRHTAACLAKVRGVTLERIAEVTTSNAIELFGL